MSTEKEKMLKGELYYANAPELFAEREYARKVLFQFNSTLDRGERARLLLPLLGSVKQNFHIESVFHFDYGYNIHLGENFYANVGCTILDEAEVRFGDNVLLAPNVGIYTACHPTDVEQRVAGIEFAKPVKIGDNVWIGADVTILPGVSIGDNAVIGAGSVVVHDIPADTVAVGNPCKVIKKMK